MSHDTYSLDELARKLGRDRREIEKLVNRGRIPGRKVNDNWQFHHVEITHWLEREMRAYTDGELAGVEESQQSAELDAQFPVSSLLKPENVSVPLNGRTKRSVLESLVEVAGRTWHIWEPAAVLQAVQAREDVMSTGFDNGVAIPHPRNPLPDSVGESVIAYGRTLTGIPFGGQGRQLADLFFLVVAKDSKTHLQVLARLGRMIQDNEFLEALRETDDEHSSYELILQAEATVGN